MRRWLQRSLRIIPICALAGFALACALVPPFDVDLNQFHGLRKVVDRHGNTLRIALGPEEIYCDPVPLADSGKWTAQAFIAFEDKRFMEHGGIDPMAIGRAVLRNIKRGRVTSGASTLTTLVVKMTEPRSRNLWTKWVEAHHAIKLESMLSKEAIMEQFLNRAPFGGNLYGIEAASQRYFGKPARNLSLAESALLAGLPQSPTKLRPDRFPARARRRRNRVLEQMLANRFISQKQYKTARAQPLTLRAKSLPFLAPHFCNDLLQHNPTEMLLETTLDLKIQKLAETALKNRVAELANLGVRSGAVVVADAQSGEVLALVGSAHFAESQVNAAAARRSPGSTLKPFVFAEALERGAATPASLYADIPMHFSSYSPENFSRTFSGPTTMRRALVDSLNIPALQCLQQVGMEPFINQLRKLGISTLDRPKTAYGLGLVVGSCETTLLDLVEAYSCLARGGTTRPLQLLAQPSDTIPQRLYSAETAFMVADMLGGDARSQSLIGHRADAILPRIAWKTGTSSGYRDAWTLAYNPQFVVGVWMGNPNGAGSSVLIGSKAAAPVAGAIFRALYPDGDAPWFEKPDGLRLLKVCALSGCPPNAFCKTFSSDYAIPHVSPSQTCQLHQEDQVVWPRNIQAFLESSGMADHTDAAPELKILSPAPNASFRLLPKSPGIQQSIALSASIPNPFWFVNGKRIPNNVWELARGQHTIACADASGASDQLQILVE